MRLLKQLLTPAGALAMLIGLWLPWADLRCAQVRTEPNFWQLARNDERLYLLLVPVLILLVCGLWSMRKHRRSLAITSALGAVTGVGFWTYLWFKKDEMAEYQAQVASGAGGDLARMFQELHVVMGVGYKMYLAGALVALAGAALRLASGESDSPP